MALTQDEIAQLNQLLESSDDVSESDVVQVLNASLEGDEFVRESSLAQDAGEIPDSFFKNLNPQDIVKNRRQVVTQGVWSQGRGTLRFTDMFNFSEQVDEESGDYFWEVYGSDPVDDVEGSRVQFYVAYGHENGGGSRKITTSQPDGQEASKAVYSQHKNVVKSPANLNSNFFQTEGGSFYVPLPSADVSVYSESDIDGIPNNSSIDLSVDADFEGSAIDPDASAPRSDSSATPVVQVYNTTSGEFLGQARVEGYNASTDLLELQSAIDSMQSVFNGSDSLKVRVHADAKVISVEGQDQFFAIHLDRSRYKQKFDPGNWEIRLLFPGIEEGGFVEGSSGYEGPIQVSSGSQGNYENTDQGLPTASEGNYSVLKLVDDAAETDFNNEQLSSGTAGNEFDVLSGSLNLDRNNTNTPDVIRPEEYTQIGKIPQRPYGKFYPDLGLILLDPKMLQYHALYVNKDGPRRNVLPSDDGTGDEFAYENLEAAVTNGSDDEYVQEYFTDETDISRELGELIENNNSALDPTLRQEEQAKPVTEKDDEYQNHEILYNAVKRGGYFAGRSAEEIISSTYFIRAQNREFNFSNNPTFVDRNSGRIKNEEFVGDPKVYITTVGLYDDSNNLVAVGKLSNPVLKDFQNEALIRVKLDY